MPIELAGRNERQAPFERLAENPSDFIDDEYRPTGVSLNDPRAMKRDSLILFFKHMAQREDLYGIPQAFKFHTVLSSRKKGTLIPARYKPEGEEPGDESSPLPVPRRRRKAPEDIGNAAALLSPDTSEDPTPVSATPATYTGPAQSSAEITVTPAKATRALQIQPSANIGTGLITPVDTGLITPVDTPGHTPNRLDSSSPPVRNRGNRKKGKFRIPEGEREPPDELSLSQPRRSQRTSVQTIDSANPKPIRKTKKNVGV
jgi:hypothetical protein